MYLLDRDPLWSTLKPYELKFDPPPGFPKSNAVPRKNDGIVVKDIRGREADFSIEKNGFAIMGVDSDITVQDFVRCDGDELAKRYFKPLADTLKAFLRADRIQIIDFKVRKSHPDFPISTGENYEFSQPATLLHIDTSPATTTELVSRFNPESPELLTRRYQYVNVWKPLTGPVRSWPLAVCDSSTVNAAKDLQARDIVFPDGALETFQVHPSSAYKFYYLSQQQTDETMVMPQSDSAGLTGVPHTAFPNPWAAGETGGRESIESRALVYYKD
ncbi:uncharacterized protein N0V89_008921 [Didymosphaeria variabile]|uniref:Methyltransferase n=1 Tax=Didymosphaeria variabile TaxID=1932322 RepID=A0A9W9C898_9PLEO|nr:uncharacterized protein N0V89_008921 [Didymosphaeria variabile]KAJ4350300.1 hypothetical protein N0V89_008921 [Didymosphaeria variabile]